MSNIRKLLGLGEKADPNTTHLPADYFDQPEIVDEAPRIEASAEETASDEPLNEVEAMAAAAERLEKIELGEGSWSLIDRALDSIARNTGAGLDEEGQLTAKYRAQLAKLADNDLSVIVQGIIAASAATDAAGNVYSYLYAVLKNCVFFANLDYRFAEGMDQYSDEATVQEFFVRYTSSTYVEEALSRVVSDRTLSADDTREYEQERKTRSDQGFEDRRDIELRYLQEKYGAEDPADAVLQALNDIQIFFDLTVASLGWDSNERPMPFGNVREPDGKFTPINDAQNALDAAEIARQASQKKRREKRAQTMADAATAVAAIMAKSMQRPNVHLRK